MILLPYAKLIVRVRCYLFAIFFKFTGIELADNIAKRCQNYKMNKIKCYSSNSSHFISLYTNNIRNESVPVTARPFKCTSRPTYFDAGRVVTRSSRIDVLAR